MSKKKNEKIQYPHLVRAFSMPDLSTDEKGKVLEGHAAVFGQTTNICSLSKYSGMAFKYFPFFVRA